MGLLKSVKHLFFPLKREDPDFGRIHFIYISGNPERSYWEAEWIFPPTGMPISISLDGDETGPRDNFREWYLRLPGRFDEILQLARPKLVEVVEDWMNCRLPGEILDELKVTGFSVQDPQANPVEWEISFETIGESWLGITIPFAGSDAQEAIVDT